MSDKTINNTLQDALKRNAAMLTEIAGWVTGYRMGSDAGRCMERIAEAMQREGYITKGKI